MVRTVGASFLQHQEHQVTIQLHHIALNRLLHGNWPLVLLLCLILVVAAMMPLFDCRHWNISLTCIRPFVARTIINACANKVQAAQVESIKQRSVWANLVIAQCSQCTKFLVSIARPHSNCDNLPSTSYYISIANALHIASLLNVLSYIIISAHLPFI